MEPEYFQFLLLMLISVGKSRPDNLMLLANQIGDSLVRAREESASKQEAEGEEKMEFSDVERVSAFIQLLNDVFWRLLSKRPLSPVVAPVVNPGMYVHTYSRTVCVCVCACVHMCTCLHACVYVCV